MKAASISSIGLIALVLLAALWASASTSSQAQDGGVYHCPEAGKWAISVWDGGDGMDTGQALATCGSDAVSAAYYLEPQTGGWLRWFAGRPEISNLTTLNDLQGIIALGSPSANPVAPAAAPAGEDSIQSCPPPGRWAISVWGGDDGVGADQALASCGAGAVSAAYYLDPQTGGWLRWFPERPDISNLITLSNLQGIIALGAGFSLPTPTADCPVDDPEFCEFATETGEAARTGNVSWFIEHAMLSPCPCASCCEAESCIGAGRLGGESGCVTMSTFEQWLSDALSGGRYLFGLIYPESPYLLGGPALLFGGGETGLWVDAQRSGAEWKIAAAMDMSPLSLYWLVDRADIEYWPDASGAADIWLDADLYEFLQGLPEHVSEYKIDRAGFADDGKPIVEITLYATLTQPSLQWCNYVQQLKDYGQHALEWIHSQGVDPDKLVIIWHPEDWAAPSGPPCP
jgi:hypothetical protein